MYFNDRPSCTRVSADRKHNLYVHMYIWHWRSHGVFEMEQGLLTVGIGTVHIFQHEPAFSDSYSCVQLCISLFTAAALSGEVSARQSPSGAPAAAQVPAHGGRRDVGRPDTRGMGPRYSESTAALS